MQDHTSSTPETPQNNGARQRAYLIATAGDDAVDVATLDRMVAASLPISFIAASVKEASDANISEADDEGAKKAETQKKRKRYNIVEPSKEQTAAIKSVLSDNGPNAAFSPEEIVDIIEGGLEDLRRHFPEEKNERLRYVRRTLSKGTGGGPFRKFGNGKFGLKESDD